jgi:hypothetical protein
MIALLFCSGTKTIAQLSLSAGIQHVNTPFTFYYGFEYLPIFFTLRKDFNDKFSSEIYYSYLNAINYPAIDFAGFELRDYQAQSVGTNFNINILCIGKFKSSILVGINYRMNAVEDINSHPLYPEQRSTHINVNGFGGQIGFRELVQFNNGMELWGSVRYNRNVNGLLTNQLLFFDLNLGVPVWFSRE